MKFQISSFNGLKVTVGTKSVTHAHTHARTHARSKSNMPHQLFQTTICQICFHIEILENILLSCSTVEFYLLPRPLQSTRIRELGSDVIRSSRLPLEWESIRSCH